MKNKRKKVIIVIASSLALTGLLYLGVIIIGGGIISGELFNPRINQEQMERIFAEDYDLLTTVANYLMNSEHVSISISPELEKGFLFVFSDDLGRQNILVNDENVVAAIEALRMSGYGIIIKDNNIISFLRWSSMNRGRGILYSIGGSWPDQSVLPFFTILEPLSKDGWFFYEQS